MKIIGSKRHQGALKKELIFWKKPNILASQKFRTTRYIRPLNEAAAIYGADKIQNSADYGSGPSCVLQNLKPGFKWYIDPLLDAYKEKFGDEIPKGKHISQNIEDADLPANTFDLAICLNALDHVRNPWQALAKIYSTIKPGGVFLLSLYTRGPLLAFLRNLQESLHLSTDPAHPYTFTQQKVENELIKAGFVIKKAEILEEEADRKEFCWTCQK